MSDPHLENSPQVSVVYRNQEIQTLAADTSYQALAESVRLGRAERCFQDAQAHCLQGPIQLGGVNAVAAVDEESVPFLSRDYLPELLKSLSDVEMSDSAPRAREVSLDKAAAVIDELPKMGLPAKDPSESVKIWYYYKVNNRYNTQACAWGVLIGPRR